MANKILVTGATGFVGSRLVPRLLNDGFDVSVVVREGSDVAYLDKCLDNIKRVQIKANTTGVDLSRMLLSIKPDVVVHLASLYISEHETTDIESLINANVLFGCQLLEAMDGCDCKRLVNIGTSWQHFNNADYEPVNLYAATKQAFLDIATYYNKAREFKIIDLKLFDTYGPGDLRKKLIPFLIGQLGKNEEIALSPGNQHINISHIDDVLNCIEKAIYRLLGESLSSIEEYAIDSDEIMSLKELVLLIERVSGKSLSAVNWGARDYRAREVMTPWNKTRRLPGWKPEISLEDGLKQLL